MRSLKVLYNEQLLYDALFYCNDSGIRGYIEVNYYNSNEGITESNPSTEFYITPEGQIHLTNSYFYFAGIKYSLAFEYMKYRLVCELLNESNEELNELALWSSLNFPPTLSYKVNVLSNLDNLSYLFEHMLFYNCSPIATIEFLNKLKMSESENEFDGSAAIIIDDIKDVIENEEYIPAQKVKFLEEIIKNNLLIFANYEKAMKKERELNGNTVSWWSENKRVYR